MPGSRTPLWRRLLPWLVSAGALAYVFGRVVDWRAIPAATERANLPLFVAICIVDKTVFFAFWAWIQAAVIRRLVEPVETRRIVEVKGASELLRVLSNPLSDAAFFFGVARLVRARVAAVTAVAVIPYVCHGLVLLAQATLALALLDDGAAAHHGVTAAVAVGWASVATLALVARFGVATRAGQRLAGSDALAWLRLRNLTPFLGWFVVLAAADVLVQGLATRAFGVPIPWLALAARIPLLYLALAIPSLANFGTREVAWAQLFADQAPRGALVAYSLWTNVVFLAMNAAIGAVFLPRAIRLVRELRRARQAGRAPPEPLLHDAADP